jgi:hypothetical protein
MVVLTYVPASERPTVTILDTGLVTIKVGETDISFMREQFDDLVFEIEAALAREEVAKQELESNEDS